VNEHSFIKSVHRSLHNNVTKWKIHDRYNGGVPDSFYMGPKGSLWAEYKYLKQLPKRDNTNLRLGLSLLQIEWLNLLYEYNHTVCVILGVEDTAIILLEKQWTANISKRYYLEQCIPRREVRDYIQSICLLEDEYENKGKASYRRGKSS
jgi:hypothetical protein